MLCAVGDLVEDVVAHLDGGLRPGADAPARISRHRGGSAANVAAVAARLTGRARFVGAVGEDELGDRLLAALARLGVEHRVARGGRTGTIVALVAGDGERSFVTDRGAASTLTQPDGDVLAGVTVLHLPGYGLAAEPLATAVRELAGRAHDGGVPVAVDPSSLTIGAELGVARYREALASLAPDVLLPNRAEAAQLDLVDRPLAPLTVVTAGGHATMVVDGERRTVVPVPVPERPVVDTTGAGDAFAGAFLTTWADTGAVDGGVVAGHAAAAHTLGGPGADWWDGP